MKRLFTVIILAVAVLIFVAQQDRNLGTNSPVTVHLWGDGRVDWAFNQPHFSDRKSEDFVGQLASDRATLTGQVMTADGKPAGAIVLVKSARRKTGAADSAYTHYPHLPKRTQTDSQGNFKIEALDPKWSYYLQVIAAGCQPKSLDQIDPDSGPLLVRLEAVQVTNRLSDKTLRGRVLNPQRKPVSGVLIRILGVTRNGMMHWPASDIDYFSVTDEAGNFVVYGKTAFTEAEGAVEIAGFATTLFERWASGDIVHELILAEGASLQGRLMQAGQPVVNAEIRINRFGRGESGSSMWDYSALTDDQGRFSFHDLPSNRSCTLYALMESLKGYGALSERRVEIYTAGSTNDLGDLNLEAAFKVEGQIRLKGSQQIPPNAQVILARATDTGDSMPLILGKDGLFHFAGVPAGAATLYLRIPGYQLSPRDPSLVSGSATNITVVTNVNGLVIEMKPIAKR